MAAQCLLLLFVSGAFGVPSTEGQNSRETGTVGLADKSAWARQTAKAASVLIAEDFETGSIEDLKKRWDNVSDKGGKVLSLVPGGPEVGGKRCLQLTATLGENTGGHLYRRLPRALDRVFARFYVKFEPDADYIHHFVHLGGYNPATSWPQGGAGVRPRGDERVTVGIEPHGGNGRFAPPGAWSFYNYWQDMKVSADGKFWGNAIRPEAPALVPRDKWQCVEVMLKLNSSPELYDGELALWLDGKLAMRVAKGTKIGDWSGMGFGLTESGKAFEGFRWRKSTDLKINFFWLLHYVTENAARQNRVATPKKQNRVWFDDIVVATQYVGPIPKAQGHL